jgi:hypothetical protein
MIFYANNFIRMKMSKDLNLVSLYRTYEASSHDKYENKKKQS